MNAGKALAEAVRALVVTPAGVPRHNGQAPSSSTLPWVVVGQSLPGVVERTETGDPAARVGRVRVTIAGANEDAVLTIADVVVPSLEGARAQISGWATSPLRQVGELRVYPDDQPTLSSGVRPTVGAALFEYTVTAVPSDEES